MFLGAMTDAYMNSDAGSANLGDLRKYGTKCENPRILKCGIFS